ncbi:hypothetical protein KLEB273_gp068 [Bacillus phage vB_BauM_KLEB27-3]|nr:hypothetical protein KLEB273_gp068 [Bacillus phage vB_BauM_KLEB27-3]
MTKSNDIEAIKTILNKTKGEICKEFEKVCSTERSFIRSKKEMHDIFDDLYESLERYIR